MSFQQKSIFESQIFNKESPGKPIKKVFSTQKQIYDLGYRNSVINELSAEQSNDTRKQIDIRNEKFESPKGDNFDYEKSAGLKEESLRFKHDSPVIRYKTEGKVAQNNVTPTRIRTGAITARKSQNSNLTIASIERYQNLAFNYNKICQETESSELKNLQKQLRDLTAKFEKEKAVLCQQVELLTLQLDDASNREKQIKNDHDIVIKALNEKLFNEMRLSRECNNYEEIANLQKENQLLKQQIKLHEINEMEHLKEINKQKQQIINKEALLIAERENHIIQQSQASKLELQLMPELQRQLRDLKKDYEKQFQNEQDKFLKRERELNQSILNYQKELQAANHEIQNQLKINHMLDLKQIDLEKQIKIKDQKVKALDKKLSQSPKPLSPSRNSSLRNPQIINSFGRGFQSQGRKYSTHDRLTIENVDVESYGSPRTRSNYSRQGVTLNINLMQDKDLEALIRDNDKDPYTKMHLMSRLIASLRSQLSKLQVKYNDLKTSSNEEIEKLSYQVQFEKIKRVQTQEEKLEKRNQMMQQLEDRDQKIMKLKNQINRITDGAQTTRELSGGDTLNYNKSTVTLNQKQIIQTTRSNSATKSHRPETQMEAYRTALPPKSGGLFQKYHQRQFTQQQSAIVIENTQIHKEHIYDTLSKKNPPVQEDNWFLKSQVNQHVATSSMIQSDNCISQSCSKKVNYKNTGIRKGVASPGQKFIQFQPDGIPIEQIQMPRKKSPLPGGVLPVKQISLTLDNLYAKNNLSGPVSARVKSNKSSLKQLPTKSEKKPSIFKQSKK